KKAALIALICAAFPIAAQALSPVNETALQSAWALYTKQQYAASADAFEALLKTSTPSPRLYYYAAMANKSCNRLPRAQQLCQYVITNFPQSIESVYCGKLFPPAPAAAPSTGLPDSLKGKSLAELMQTEEGRKALHEALQQQKSTSAAPAASSAPTYSPHM